MRILLLALALASAGCVAPGVTTPEVDAQDSNVLPWGLFECRYLVGWTPVEPDALRPYLPEGFEPSPFSFLPRGTPAERTILGVEAFLCAEGMGLNGTIPDMPYGSYWTSVDPPDEIETDDVDVYTVRWDTLVPDEDRRARLVEAGLPARAGTAELRSIPAGLFGSYDMEGVGTTTMTMSVSRPPSPGDGGVVVEFTPTPNGLAVWRADYAWDSDVTSGYGSITFPAGSWAADVVGSTTAPGQFHAGTWTFSDASLVLPTG